MQVESILIWVVMVAAVIVAGIVGVKVRRRVPITKLSGVQYGYKVSTRDPGP